MRGLRLITTECFLPTLFGTALLSHKLSYQTLVAKNTSFYQLRFKLHFMHRTIVIFSNSWLSTLVHKQNKIYHPFNFVFIFTIQNRKQLGIAWKGAMGKICRTLANTVNTIPLLHHNKVHIDCNGFQKNFYYTQEDFLPFCGKYCVKIAACMDKASAKMHLQWATLSRYAYTKFWCTKASLFTSVLLRKLFTQKLFQLNVDTGFLVRKHM
jgi:hypothetical protein